MRTGEAVMPSYITRRSLLQTRGACWRRPRYHSIVKEVGHDRVSRRSLYNGGCPDGRVVRSDHCLAGEWKLAEGYKLVGSGEKKTYDVATARATLRNTHKAGIAAQRIGGLAEWGHGGVRGYCWQARWGGRYWFSRTRQARSMIV